MKAVIRCSWCEGDTLYELYHDEEWGVPEYERGALFESLTLEGMQAGLSWLTVLKKRNRMRQVFFDFDVARLARAAPADVERWLEDPGVIRHRGKLEAMVNNARLVDRIPEFSEWLWQFAPTGTGESKSEGLKSRPVLSQSEESRRMSGSLKILGFRFVGPTTCHAFMQSVGMLNDHAQDCWRYAHCAELSRRSV